MKANPGKCHLLLSAKSPEVVCYDGIKKKHLTLQKLY